MDVQSDVAVADDRRLARMDAHPNTERQPLECALARRRGRDGVVRAAERVEERIALCVHLVSGIECVAQPRAVLLEHPSVLVGADLRKQLRRALDVREEERDGAARERVHARTFSVIR
jgi:hypothetical protein